MTERFELEERHEAHREEVREFCEGTIESEIDRYEREGEFPVDLVRLIGEAGFTGVPFPEDVDGGGADYRSFAITVEELARTWKLTAGAVNIACGLVGYPIYEFGTDRQREAWLARICRGEWIPAFALTEPEAGSDAANLETTAKNEGGEWVIDGHKIWTTHGAVADFLLVVARTGGEGHEGISLIGVPNPREREGFAVVRNIPCMEGDTAVESELRFDGLRVPAENLVGEEGRGFRYIMEGLDIGRLGTAAQGVGIAQGAFEASREFAGEREQFGKPIREFQGVGFKLADMAARTEAARLLTLSAADGRDRGERITQEAAMAKTFATDAAMEIATEAVQVHGARGYSEDYPLERYMREAKGTQIYDGTNEINRLVVANRLYE
ncbi:acyl-CoA dehydrogenase family protein [Natrononativus amylolyticus]|uniref:acyl-CoA dehydrogenase family protein n=1 Tax=Natrononativus amylolyticus TaxID=2963434 RepID=UPI0020CFE349|nr:acyl-CoA dehydrogenase family protein [Natrononativus amylolyticus]